MAGAGDAIVFRGGWRNAGFWDGFFGGSVMLPVLDGTRTFAAGTGGVAGEGPGAAFAGSGDFCAGTPAGFPIFPSGIRPVPIPGDDGVAAGLATSVFLGSA